MALVDPICNGTVPKGYQWKKHIVVAYMILVCFVALVQCFTGSDVLRWRSFYATQDNAWKAHYREVFDRGIREALCCLGRFKYLSALEEDEVHSVARLLGDLVAYRASGTGHLELLAGLALLKTQSQLPKSYEGSLEASVERIQDAAVFHPFAEAAYTNDVVLRGERDIRERNLETPAKKRERMGKGESSNTKATIISASSFLRSVTLHDWWLLKTNANRLAVGGFATRERQGIRVFSSGAIAKRHDATTLETADGITITIVGFLNKSRTHQNGFPSEVCKHFLFGFPYHWEEYAVQCFVGESTKSGVSKKPSGCEEFNLPSTSSENNLLPASLDELPVTRVRDLLMSTLGDSKTLTNSIFSDIVGRVSNLSNMKGNSPTTVDTELDRTPRNHKKAEVEKFEDDNSILDVSDMRTEECKKNICQSSGVMNDSTPSRRVSTRTMIRLKNLKSQLEWNLSSSTSKKQKTRENSEKRLLTNSSNDVLRRSSGNDFKHARKDMKTNGPIKTMDSDLDKFIKHKMAKVEQKRTDNCVSMDTMDIRKEECQKYFCQSEVGMHALSPDRGVATRSMARLKNVKNNP